MGATEGVMEQRITRLRAHLRNIDRYQSLLETKLSEAEQRYLERRLSEECFAIKTLNFTSSEIEIRSSQSAKPDRKGSMTLVPIGNFNSSGII